MRGMACYACPFTGARPQRPGNGPCSGASPVASGHTPMTALGPRSARLPPRPRPARRRVLPDHALRVRRERGISLGTELESAFRFVFLVQLFSEFNDFQKSKNEMGCSKKRNGWSYEN